MAAVRRLKKDLQDLRKTDTKCFRNVQVDESNTLTLHGLLLPNSAPYNKGAFRIGINFPKEYPFKPPEITFKTKIYHLNIGKNGKVHLHDLLCPSMWNPATRFSQVIQALLATVDNPDPNQRLRNDLAEEFLEDKEKFFRNAEEFTKKFSEKRPYE